MMTLNGKPVSEFRLCALAAASLGVPVAFISGDKALMEEVEQTNPHIGRLAVKEGRGHSTISMTPLAAQNAIRAGVEKSLHGKLKDCLLPLPEKFTLDLTYVSPAMAYEKSFYPGCKYLGNRTNRVEAATIFDVMRALRFIK
jgi:D-amino peptidase